MAFCANNYVPELSLKIFHGTKGMGSWHGMIKYNAKTFWETHKHFKETNIINFDIIHREAQDEKVSDELIKYYQTIWELRILKYPKPEQNKILSSSFRTDRPDLFFEKNIVLNHFKKKLDHCIKFFILIVVYK